MPIGSGRSAWELGLGAIGAAPAEPYDRAEQAIAERRAEGFSRTWFHGRAPRASCHPERLLEGRAQRRLGGAFLLAAGSEPSAGEGRLARHARRDRYAELRLSARGAGERSAALIACSSTPASMSIGRRPCAPGSASSEERARDSSAARFVDRARNARERHRDRAGEGARAELRQLPLVIEACPTGALVREVCWMRACACRTGRRPVRPSRLDARADGHERLRLRHMPTRLSLEPGR